MLIGGNSFTTDQDVRLFEISRQKMEDEKGAAGQKLRFEQRLNSKWGAFEKGLKIASPLQAEMVALSNPETFSCHARPLHVGWNYK